jgi:hypothetical protein
MKPIQTFRATYRSSRDRETLRDRRCSTCGCPLLEGEGDLDLVVLDYDGTDREYLHAACAIASDVGLRFA